MILRHLKKNPSQDLQTSPSQGNPQDQTQCSPSDREQSLSKNQVLQKAKDPIAPETETDKNSKAFLKDVEKTSPLWEKTTPSFKEKEHKQNHGTLGTVSIQEDLSHEIKTTTILKQSHIQEDVLQKIFSLQNTMSSEPDKETPLTKIEHLTSALDFVRDATRRKGMVQDLEKTISTLDTKSRQTLEINLQTMEKIQRHTPHLIRSDSMTMEL